MRWFRAQFVDRHTWRDVDVAHWWQMPDDDSRTESPWLQLVVDSVTRAPFSEWHEKVAVARVRHYDRVRPYATRAVLLLMISAGVALLQARWWCWVMLSPALLQIVLEIYLHRFVHETADEPKWKTVRWMRDVADRHHRTKLLNVTGVLGVLACPLNVAAVSIAPPGGDVSWVKVVAFAAAVLYVNSGLASTFLDPANYTETSKMPPAMHRVRAFAPLLSMCAVAAIAAIGVHFGRWAPVMIPLAYATSALTLLLGSKIRDHDRVVAAAAFVGREAVVAARRELGNVVHDDLNGAKIAAERVRKFPGVPYRDKVELAALEAFLTHFSTDIGIYAAPMLDLADLAEKIASPYGLGPRDIDCDFSWPPDMRKENHAIAVRMITALVHNAGQALNKTDNLDLPRSISVLGFTTGSGQSLGYHVALADSLPPIPSDRWCAEGTTLAALREWLIDTFNGDLRQEPHDCGRKRIVASWYDLPPVRGYQGRGVEKEMT